MTASTLPLPGKPDASREVQLQAATELAILSEAPREALIASVLYANLAVFAALLLAGEGMSAFAAIAYVLSAFLVFALTSAWIAYFAIRLSPKTALRGIGATSMLNDAAFAAALVFDVLAAEKSYPNTAISTVATIAYVTLPVSARQFMPFLIGKAIIFGTCVAYILVREDYEYGDIAFVPPIILGFLLIAAIGFWVHTRFIEQHRLRQELRFARDDAERAHALRQRLFNFVGHDLRQPLAALQYIHFDLQNRLKSTEAATVLKDAGACLEDANMLIEDILQLSTKEGGMLEITLEPISVFEVVEDVLAPLRQLANAGGGEFVVHHQAAEMLADRALLERIIRNLTTNSLQHATGSDIHFFAQKDRAITELVITDDGPGIEEESATTAASGFGLGLSIAEHFCKSMGGALVIEAGREKGTRCRVRLPAPRA